MCVHRTKLDCPMCGTYRGAVEGKYNFDESGIYLDTTLRKKTGKTKFKFFDEYEVYYTCKHCKHQFTETVWL